MTLRSIFLNKWGRLRSGWRVTIFAVMYIAFQIAAAIALGVFYQVLTISGFSIRRGGYVDNFIQRVIILVPALLAGYLCTRLLEGLPWRTLGLTFHWRWFSQFLVGSVIGATSLALATAIATAFGGLKFSFAAQGIMFAVLRALVSAAGLFIIAALAEEALFRGYPLQTLTRAQLAWLGVLITSVPFAAVHLANPNVVAGFTFVNTALAGVWLAVAYLRTRSLWFPLGVHWAWNWTMDSIFGLPVSGMKIGSHSVLNSVDLGPAWLTGGSYGIEGGIACVIAVVLSTIFIWRTRWVSPTPEMMTLTSQENPASRKQEQQINADNADQRPISLQEL
jgi:membrane protease YdiL (CAAX protease family)